MAPSRVCSACGKRAPPGAERCPWDGTALPGEPATLNDPIIGSVVGEYLVQSKIGAGGMGVVYRGVHQIIGKTAAIKVLQWDAARDPGQGDRLISEARAVNAAKHRGIVDIFGFGTLPDGRQYLLMEFLEGKPLDVVIKEQAPMLPMVAFPILEEILDALRAAHSVGVIHRDLKPSNVFVVTPPSGSSYVKLLDFGLAKQAPTPEGVTPQTHQSILIGTPHFMAPEQARGAPVSPRTDLYSLGVLAFNMLTGRLPFEAETVYEVVSQHLNNAPPSPSVFERSIPPVVDELILHLLAKRPEDRPPSAEAVRQEFASLRKALEVEDTHLSAPRPVPALPSLRGAPSASATQSSRDNLPSSSLVATASISRLPTVQTPPPKWPVRRVLPVAMGAGVVALVTVILTRTFLVSKESGASPSTETPLLSPRSTEPAVTPAETPQAAATSPASPKAEPPPASATSRLPAKADAPSTKTLSRATLEARMRDLQRHYRELVARHGEDQLKVTELGPYHAIADDFREQIERPATYKELDRGLAEAETALSRAWRRLGR